MNIKQKRMKKKKGKEKTKRKSKTIAKANCIPCKLRIKIDYSKLGIIPKRK
jgi:hypothetical protein